jgi:ubiquinone/menaquinone biosynthesis C-methylase UbiE
LIDYGRIYRSQAEEYDLLVSREDAQGKLLPALARAAPLRGRVVVELGCGTGRLTRMVAPLAARVMALDVSEHMLGVARVRMGATSPANYLLMAGDSRRLPLADESADVALAGWTLSFLIGSQAAEWRWHIDRAVDEMFRVLRPGGAAVIVETLGTGYRSPRPPSEALAAYYRHLEAEHGFSRTWVRTDYAFGSPEEAERLTRFFFGRALAERVARERLTILPECTGIWRRTA